MLQRDGLPAPDIGFAFLPQYRSLGYAYEAASAVKADAHSRLGVETILAIVNPDNTASIRLLGKLGFGFERMMRLTSDEHELKLFASRAVPVW